MDTPFEHRLTCALDALSTDPSLTLARAAKHYGVSRRTLGRRRDDGLSRQQAHEGRQVLSNLQEEELVQ